MPRNFKLLSPTERRRKQPEYNRAEEEAALRELEELDDAPGRLELAEVVDPLLDEIEDEETLQEVAEQTNYGAIFLNDLIKRQRALSLSVAITFLVIIFSFPLLNFFLRSLVAFQLFGFEISWLFLGVLVYPFIWALAFYFVTTADKYEEEFTKLVK